MEDFLQGIKRDYELQLELDAVRIRSPAQQKELEYKVAMRKLAAVMPTILSNLDMQASIHKVASEGHCPDFLAWLNKELGLPQGTQAPLEVILLLAEEKHGLDPVPFYDQFLEDHPKYKQVFASGKELMELVGRMKRNAREC
jgi:hypothetical protein